MLGSISGDHRFESAYNEVVHAGKEQTMCSVLNEIQEKGRVEGRAEGRSEGHTEGWSDAKNYYIEALIQNLMSENPSLSKDSARKRAIVKSKFVCKLLLGTCGAKGCLASLS